MTQGDDKFEISPWRIAARGRFAIGAVVLIMVFIFLILAIL